MYACEGSTLKKADIMKLKACEMWCWRRVMKVKWTDRVTNEVVLQNVKEERQLINSIYRRKRKWAAHNIRHSKIFRLMIEGRMKGKRSRGRKRVMLTDSITNGQYYLFKERALMREV